MGECTEDCRSAGVRGVVVFEGDETLGAAASALNVTRRGLASGRQDLIERLAALVTVEDDGEGSR